MHRDPTSFTWTVVPANSQVVIPFDSTWAPNCATTSIATNSAFLVPGPNRYIWAGVKVNWTALCTTQNVVILFQDLTGAANAAADWETQGAAGSVTLVAAATQVGEFKPEGTDWRIRVDAGATGPATFVFKGTIIFTQDYGS
jgi:hypothetical protein